jgi:hypothetical protein
MTAAVALNRRCASSADSFLPPKFSNELVLKKKIKLYHMPPLLRGVSHRFFFTT